MTKIIRFLPVLLCSLSACGGAGAPGPAGPAGPQGAAGVAASPPVQTCSTTPPPLSVISHQCPIGELGSWQSSAGWTSAAYPTCWVSTGDFQPQSAPVGACTPDPTIVAICLPGIGNCPLPLPAGTYLASGPQFFGTCVMAPPITVNLVPTLTCTGLSAAITLSFGSDPDWLADGNLTSGGLTYATTFIPEIVQRSPMPGSWTLYDNAALSEWTVLTP
jgi:hypothetical protein